MLIVTVCSNSFFALYLRCLINGKHHLGKTLTYHHKIMKKTILSLGLLSAMAFAANAQDAATVPAESGFKPGAGNITVEVLASTPFASANTFNLNNNQLRFRYFLSETMAFRLGFAINNNSFKNDYSTKTETSVSNNGNTANSTSNSNNNNGTVTIKSRNLDIVFTPGIEFHKGVSERLSVYYGAYALVAFGSAKGTIEVTPGSNKTVNTSPAGTQTTTGTEFAGSYKYEIKGSGFVNNGVNPYDGNTGVTVPNLNRATNRLGLNLVIGADYYITKALYLGLECSWGLTASTSKKYTTELSNSLRSFAAGSSDVANPQNTSVKTEVAKSTSTSIAPAVNGAFRFGFWF